MPSTVVFNHPTIDALTAFLLGEISSSISAAGQAEEVTLIAFDDDPEAAEEWGFDGLSEDELELLLAERLAKLS
jgi:hypothetical protein